MDRSLDDLSRELAGSDPTERKRRLAALLDEDLVRLEQATEGAVGDVAPPTWLRELLAPATAAGSPDLSVDIEEHACQPPTEPEEEDWLQMLADRFLAGQQSQGTSPPPLAWGKLRCRGDARLLEELNERFHLESYLDARLARIEDYLTESQRHRILLRDGIRLTPALSPRVFEVYASACRRLRVSPSAEIFCSSDRQIVGSALLDRTGTRADALVCLSAGALEDLDDDELAALIGHELGHFLLDQWKLTCLWNKDAKTGPLTVLPALGESVFLRWKRFGELSADRASVIAAGGFAPAARLLVKVVTGLSPRNLVPDINALLEQFEEVAGLPEAGILAGRAHPALAVRLKAMELFSRSRKAGEAGLDPGPDPTSDDALETQIEQLVDRIRRRPALAQQAVMEAIACAGTLLLGVDGTIRDDEVKLLVELLHRDFTDDPAGILPGSLQLAEGGLAHALPRVGNAAGKEQVVRALTEIALADGTLSGEEGAVILEVAGRLDLSVRTTWGVITGTIQKVGFRLDAKVNLMAEEIRRTYGVTTGFPAPPPGLPGPQVWPENG